MKRSPLPSRRHKMTKEKSTSELLLGVDQEGSTARTEAPASLPLREIRPDYPIRTINDDKNAGPRSTERIEIPASNPISKALGTVVCRLRGHRVRLTYRGAQARSGDGEDWLCTRCLRWEEEWV